MAQTVEQRRTVYRLIGHIGLYSCGMAAYAVTASDPGFFFFLAATLIISTLVRVCVELASKSATYIVYKDPEPVDCAYIWEQGQRAGWYDNVAHTANPNAPLSKNPYTQER